MKKPSFLLISTLLGCVAVILLLTAGQSRASAGMPPPAIGEPHWGLYFRPNTNATRGQTSKIVANTFFPGCNPSAGMLVP